MDSTISSDPFQGEDPITASEEEPTVTPFNEDRWRRAGATDEQLTFLRDRWDSYTTDEQNTEAAWMRSVSDDELHAYLQQGQDAPAAETPVAEVPAGDSVTDTPPTGDNQQP